MGSHLLFAWSRSTGNACSYFAAYGNMESKFFSKKGIRLTMNDGKFQLVSDFQPQGDQPAAIASLVEGVEKGLKHQTLLGVTGSGKTFTMASIVAKLNRPTLVIAHNKTLAAQLAAEFKEFFPGQRGRILRELLRLLSTGSVHSVHRYVH